MFVEMYKYLNLRKKVLKNTKQTANCGNYPEKGFLFCITWIFPDQHVFPLKI